MNIKSTLIASALVSTLVAAACGTEAASPSLVGGAVPQQSASNYEEGLVVGAHEAKVSAGHVSADGPGPRTRTRCRMPADAVEQWVLNGRVPRCQVETRRHSDGDDRRTQ